MWHQTDYFWLSYSSQQLLYLFTYKAHSVIRRNPKLSKTIVTSKQNENFTQIPCYKAHPEIR